MEAKNETQDVKATAIEESEPARAEAEATRDETFVAPYVDIYETDESLVLLADVPGAPNDGLDLKVEDGLLEVTAHRRARLPDEEADYAECRPVSYYRAFRLSDAIDAGEVEARLRDGVLTVSLPKSSRAKPRKIEVTAG